MNIVGYVLAFGMLWIALAFCLALIVGRMARRADVEARDRAFLRAVEIGRLDLITTASPAGAE